MEHVPVKSPQIWVLEAMILVQMAGMFYPDRMSKELSDTFHGTLVTLARRLGSFEASRESPKRFFACSGRAIGRVDLS